MSAYYVIALALAAYVVAAASMLSAHEIQRVLRPGASVWIAFALSAACWATVLAVGSAIGCAPVAGGSMLAILLGHAFAYAINRHLARAPARRI